MTCHGTSTAAHADQQLDFSIVSVVLRSIQAALDVCPFGSLELTIIDIRMPPAHGTEGLQPATRPAPSPLQTAGL